MSQVPARAADPAQAEAVAAALVDRFADYNTRFGAITCRAQQRFEARDWAGARADAIERIGLYDRCVAEAATWLQAHLGERSRDRPLWRAVRDRFAVRIAPLLDQELNKTFFNTLTRRFFRTRGVDAELEFIALDIEPTDRITHPVARHSHAIGDTPAAGFRQVLEAFRFNVPWARIGHCAGGLARVLDERLQAWGERPVRAVELLDTVFYRERRAYLVGRVFGESRFAPLVIAVVHGEHGLEVDAVLTERPHVAQVFGFTQSYFHADLATVGDAVVFLRSLLPDKAVDEIYTVLGRAKQGKTERYRHFFRHLARSGGELLRHAEGERGMVMAVFTLPSYPLVFKLIRDRFAPPKDIAREQVQAKYDLVFRHDRVGRLVDAQEFRWLRFPKRQFTPELLHELLTECRETVSDLGDDVLVHHCYLERRLRPLNLFVREAAPEAALAAVLDYGQAIKDLARSGIFPGDLLLKNFGVTRNGRAIFYDYDELCLVGECRFRREPEPRNDEEEMSAGAWYHVGENDVFPEQFPRFLGLPPVLRAALLEAHADIFRVAWWQDLQTQLAAGAYADVAPYPESVRL
ncbi:bifunctional isocitrate dehydrogenase kinase/phosphatase [Arenimonas sp. MALMAid1274]|uniref:bifunctional isocitrate dehydrogenase kinase/phosphatase n=1 Tax=Arenimonas sp. MALMAid1274 TaxID=3411630 RepID=UPI003BA28C09